MGLPVIRGSRAAPGRPLCSTKPAPPVAESPNRPMLGRAAAISARALQPPPPRFGRGGQGSQRTQARMRMWIQLSTRSARWTSFGAVCRAIMPPPSPPLSPSLLLPLQAKASGPVARSAGSAPRVKRRRSGRLPRRAVQRVGRTGRRGRHFQPHAWPKCTRGKERAWRGACVGGEERGCGKERSRRGARARGVQGARVREARSVCGRDRMCGRSACARSACVARSV